jgi:hypothetical protein
VSEGAGDEALAGAGGAGDEDLLALFDPVQVMTMLIGVDLHTPDQSVAMLDTATGELRERRLRNDGEAVEQFYVSRRGI